MRACQALRDAITNIDLIFDTAFDVSRITVSPPSSHCHRLIPSRNKMEIPLSRLYDFIGQGFKGSIVKAVLETIAA
jgi:hypothetical protein